MYSVSDEKLNVLENFSVPGWVLSANLPDFNVCKKNCFLPYLHIFEHDLCFFFEVLCFNYFSSPHNGNFPLVFAVVRFLNAYQ